LSLPTDSELEQQVLRGQLFVHTGLSQHTTRIREVEALLYGLIDLLVANGVVPPEGLKRAAREIRQEQATQKDPSLPLVAMREDNEESAAPRTVNCTERLPICKAACCRLDFALNRREIESGQVKWDLGRPYFIRKGSAGYCCHNQRDTGGCGVYADRPSVCRLYSCESDQRIWKDFDKMELNHEWLANHLEGSRGGPHLVETLMHPRKQLLVPAPPEQSADDVK
jgi:Fe-S-cluster containining protein